MCWGSQWWTQGQASHQDAVGHVHADRHRGNSPQRTLGYEGLLLYHLGLAYVGG